MIRERRDLINALRACADALESGKTPAAGLVWVAEDGVPQYVWQGDGIAAICTLIVGMRIAPKLIEKHLQERS